MKFMLILSGTSYLSPVVIHLSSFYWASYGRDLT